MAISEGGEKTMEHIEDVQRFGKYAENGVRSLKIIFNTQMTENCNGGNVGTIIDQRLEKYREKKTYT